MEGVQQHVYDHLADLRRVRVGVGQVRGQVADELDPLERLLGVERIDDLAHGPVEVDRLRFDDDLPAEIKELPDDVSRPHRLPRHHPQFPAARIVLRALLQHEVREGEDGRERVVDLVGDPGRKLAHGGQLFRLNELGLLFPQFLDGVLEGPEGVLEPLFHLVERHAERRELVPPPDFDPLGKIALGHLFRYPFEGPDGSRDARGQFDVDDRSEDRGQKQRDEQDRDGRADGGVDVEPFLLRQVLGKRLDLPGDPAHFLLPRLRCRAAGGPRRQEFVLGNRPLHHRVIVVPHLDDDLRFDVVDVPFQLFQVPPQLPEVVAVLVQQKVLLVPPDFEDRVRDIVGDLHQGQPRADGAELPVGEKSENAREKDVEAEADEQFVPYFHVTPLYRNQEKNEREVRGGPRPLFLPRQSPYRAFLFGLFLYLFLHFGLLHSEAYPVEDIEDGEAPPHGVDHIEHQEARHDAGLLGDLLSLDPVEVVCRLYGLLGNVGDDLGLLDLPLFLELLVHAFEHIPPGGHDVLFIETVASGDFLPLILVHIVGVLQDLGQEHAEVAADPEFGARRLHVRPGRRQQLQGALIHLFGLVELDGHGNRLPFERLVVLHHLGDEVGRALGQFVEHVVREHEPVLPVREDGREDEREDPEERKGQERSNRKSLFVDRRHDYASSLSVFILAKNLLNIHRPKMATTIQKTMLPTNSMALIAPLDMLMYSSSTIFLGRVAARLMKPARMVTAYHPRIWIPFTTFVVSAPTWMPMSEPMSMPMARV